MAGSWGIVASITSASDVNNFSLSSESLLRDDLNNQTRLARFVPGASVVMATYSATVELCAA